MPSRSLTFTMIMGSVVGASVGAAFLCFSFLGVSVGGGERGRGRSGLVEGTVLGFDFQLKPLLVGRGREEASLLGRGGDALGRRRGGE